MQFSAVHRTSADLPWMPRRSTRSSASGSIISWSTVTTISDSVANSSTLWGDGAIPQIAVNKPGNTNVYSLKTKHRVLRIHLLLGGGGGGFEKSDFLNELASPLKVPSLPTVAGASAAGGGGRGSKSCDTSPIVGACEEAVLRECVVPAKPRKLSVATCFCSSAERYSIL